jgi:predicted enzyme related to lactoylglutathione lyase
MSAAVVHLELHTGDAGRESAFYTRLPGWRPEQIETPHGACAALELGGGLGGGVVADPCGAYVALWQAKGTR